MSFIQIFVLLHRNPPLNPHHFEKCTLLITLCNSNPNRKKARIMQPNENKIPIIKISKQGVHNWRPHILWPTIKAFNWVFYINTNNSGCQWSPKIVGSPIAWQPKPLQKNFGKKLILSFFFSFCFFSQPTFNPFLLLLHNLSTLRY